MPLSPPGLAQAAGQCGSIDLRTLDRHPGVAIYKLDPVGVVPPVQPERPLRPAEMLTAERP